MPFEFQKEAAKYHQIEHGVHYPRYQAWEFLWEYLYEMGSFNTAASPEHIEKTALHLGFYLANWGMLRASSNLPNANLAFFIDFIGCLNREVDKQFWDLTFDDFRTNSNDAIHFFDHAVSVIETFEGGLVANISWTSTLVTKILLGIWGQCPAIDRFYKQGFKLFAQEKGLRLGSNCSGSYIHRLAELAKEEKWVFDGFKSRRNSLLYPPGKILDMAFFNYGLNNS